MILLPEQDPFKPLQWPCFDPHLVTALDERMGFSFEGTLDHSTDSLYLWAGNQGWLAAEPHYGVNPRGSEDRQPAVDWAAKEYVTGEQRERKLFHSVFPAVDSGINRKESFEALAREYTGYGFLMLVASVKRVPKKGQVQSLFWNVHTVHLGAAPPCGLA